MCTVCEDNYARIGKFRCTECLPGSDPYYFIIIGFLVFLVLFSLYVLRGNVKNAEAGEKSINSVLLRILSNHIQVITLL